MNKCIKYLIITLLTLTLVTLACTINLGGPAYPTPPIPVSTEAIGQLQEEIQAAMAAGVETGDVTLVFTEPELTSYLSYELQKQNQPFITNPQVYLRDNQIQIYGTAQKSNFQAHVHIVVTASVDENGQLKIELTSADFGPFPIPADLKHVITVIIQEAYTGALGPVATGFRLETITIADGLMTLTCRIK